MFEKQPLGIQSPSETGFMEPKWPLRFVSVIGSTPNHHPLTFGEPGSLGNKKKKEKPDYPSNNTQKMETKRTVHSMGDVTKYTDYTNTFTFAMDLSKGVIYWGWKNPTQ